MTLYRAPDSTDKGQRRIPRYPHAGSTIAKFVPCPDPD